MMAEYRAQKGLTISTGKSLPRAEFTFMLTTHCGTAARQALATMVKYGFGELVPWKSNYLRI